MVSIVQLSSRNICNNIGIKFIRSDSSVGEGPRMLNKPPTDGDKESRG